MKWKYRYLSLLNENAFLENLEACKLYSHKVINVYWSDLSPDYMRDSDYCKQPNPDSVKIDRLYHPAFCTRLIAWWLTLFLCFEVRHWNENTDTWASVSSAVYNIPSCPYPALLLPSRVTGPVDIDRFNRGFAAAANQSTASGSATANEKRPGNNSWWAKRSGAQNQERIVALVNRFRDKRHFATNRGTSRPSNRQRAIVLQHLRMKQWPSGFLGGHMLGGGGGGWGG
jgi:hypothetical protein